MIDNAINWMIDTTIAVSILTIIVMVFRQPVAHYFGAKAAYLLWLAPLARVFLPELKVLPETVRTGVLEPGTLAPLSEHPIAGHAFTPPPSTFFITPIEISTIALGVWLVGAFIFLGLYLNRHQNFQKIILTESTPPSPTLQRIIKQATLRNELKRDVHVCVANDATGPLVMGIKDPIIVVPKQFESTFTVKEQHLALDHECAHIKRGDLIALFLATLLRASMWPSPVIYYAYKLFRQDQEAACDESVISKNEALPSIVTAYASAILKSASFARATPTTSLSMAHPIKERIKIMTSKTKRHPRFGALIAATIVTFGLAATASYTAQAESTKDQADKQSSIRKSIITVDDDNEEILIDGWDGDAVRKIVFNDKNGKRTIKAYDKSGKKVLDDQFSPTAEMPYKGARVLENGKERTYISFTDDGGFTHPPHEDTPHPPAPPGHQAIDVECRGDGDDPEKAIQFYSWTSNDDEGDHKFYTREVFCDHEFRDIASPEEKKKSLQRAIKTLKEEGKRSEVRREKMIDMLEAQLKELN